MSTIILGVLALSLTFVFLTYGVWVGYERYRVLAFQQRVSAMIDEALARYRIERVAVGRVPEAGRIPPASIAPDPGTGVEVVYGVSAAGVPFVCAMGPASSFVVREALERLARHRRGVIGPSCNQEAAPGATIAMTVRLV